MPHATTNDGVKLYYEETGSGTPVIFVHEYAGDYRAWEPQVRAMARRYRCITFNARGFPPSDVPNDPAKYTQQRACDDILSVLDHLKIAKAHVIGLSMGGFATLHFGLSYPDRALSLTIGGCGYGAEKGEREKFQSEAEKIAGRIRKEGMAEFAKTYSLGPTRVQMQNKDPRGWAEFASQLAEHSDLGAELTQLGVQRHRPSIFDLEDRMKKLTVPTLIITGDEDHPCLIPNVFMKRAIPNSALQVLPNAGHAINLEDPDRFNDAIKDFLAQVDSGRWPTRDPRSISETITGIR